MPPESVQPQAEDGDGSRGRRDSERVPKHGADLDELDLSGVDLQGAHGLAPSAPSRPSAAPASPGVSEPALP